MNDNTHSWPSRIIDKTDTEVLEIEGITVRRVPKCLITQWRLSSNIHGKPEDVKDTSWMKRTVKDIDPETGQYTLIEEVPVRPKIAGRYIVMLNHRSGTDVRFFENSYGIGDTIAEAWKDYLLNKQVPVIEGVTT